jgi:hypothetical protein
MSSREVGEILIKWLIYKASEDYPILVTAWKKLDYIIKHPEARNFEGNVEHLKLQKRIITTEMNMINSFRKRDVETFKVLLERFKNMAVDCITEAEDFTDGMTCFSTEDNTISSGEQGYIDKCDELKRDVEKYSNCLEALIMYKKYSEC